MPTYRQAILPTAGWRARVPWCCGTSTSKTSIISIGVKQRLISALRHFGGRPLVCAVFDKILKYMAQFSDVWFASHGELARWVLDEKIEAETRAPAHHGRRQSIKTGSSVNRHSGSARRLSPEYHMAPKKGSRSAPPRPCGVDIRPWVGHGYRFGNGWGKAGIDTESSTCDCDPPRVGGRGDNARGLPCFLSCVEFCSSGFGCVCVGRCW